MPRKRKSDQQPPAESPSSVAELPATPSEDSPAANDNKPSFAERVGQRKAVAAPDPFSIAGDYLAGVRLFESRQDRQMAIKFEEKPSQPVIDRLKEAGYRWKPEDGIWAYPVRAEAAMRTRIEAERLYQEVRQMVRQDKGIESGQEVPF